MRATRLSIATSTIGLRRTHSSSRFRHSRSRGSGSFGTASAPRSARRRRSISIEDCTSWRFSPRSPRALLAAETLDFHRGQNALGRRPMSRFYITTAIPYANGAPHIGHAYERIATDAIQRFMRLDGRDTLFVTGMDERGLKVQQAAAREGVSPQQFVDRVAAEFEAMGDMLNARADDIVRTTQPRHYRASQAIWERMAANGDIYLSKYSGWYSVRDEGYFLEDELTDGPDGNKLAPSGAPVEWVEEESYFFRLSAYANKLLGHYAA